MFLLTSPPEPSPSFHAKPGTTSAASIGRVFNAAHLPHFPTPSSPTPRLKMKTPPDKPGASQPPSIGTAYSPSGGDAARYPASPALSEEAGAASQKGAVIFKDAEVSGRRDVGCQVDKASLGGDSETPSSVNAQLRENLTTKWHRSDDSEIRSSELRKAMIKTPPSEDAIRRGIELEFLQRQREREAEAADQQRRVIEAESAFEREKEACIAQVKDVIADLKAESAAAKHRYNLVEPQVEKFALDDPNLMEYVEDGYNLGYLDAMRAIYLQE